jgi:uncharacterized membrane-anchored protein YjiN (DUF445 family)
VTATTDVRTRPDERPPSTAGREPQAAPPLREEALRLHQLRVMKRRATGLLVVMTIAFVIVVLLTPDSGWTGYLRAALEASMVGGLADWFAVTALFRHPLGIPIPHTAVIAERKDQFGQTLGTFVQQNFLSPDVITARVRSSRAVGRAAAWLADRDNAEAVAGHAADAVVGLADVLRDEDVHRLLEEEIGRLLERVPVAPIAGRALRQMTAEGRHQELFDAIVRGLQRALDENRDVLRARFDQESPWWLPDAVDDRIFDRLFDGVRSLLEDVNSDPDHRIRAQFTEWLQGLAQRLETSPELEARGEQLKKELLGHPELRRWSSSLWTELKVALRAQAADPNSEMRRRLADAVVAAGRRLQEDPALSEKAEQLAESAVRYLAEHFHQEIASLVSGTIARWDAEETSRKLELLLGRDLQFIRINGTVVGGLAGVIIHGVAQALS